MDKMSQSLQPKLFEVKLRVETHFSREEKVKCETIDHEKCDWETILKGGLESMYPELEISGGFRSTKNLVMFEIALLNRLHPLTSDITSRIDHFVSINPSLSISSIDVTPKV